MSCSEEIVYIENPELSKVISYFDKVTQIKYPEGFKEINKNYTNPFFFTNANITNRSAYEIMSTIDILKANMGKYYESSIVKSWWQYEDRIIVSDHGANNTNTSVYKISNDIYFGYEVNYFQFTMTQDKLYYMPINERISSNNYYVGITEKIWQKVDKSQGEIHQSNEQLYWEATQDSLLFFKKMYNDSTRLSINIKEYSGRLLKYKSDSVHIFKWDTLGHGSHLTKHIITGKSNTSKIVW